jgi:hypothetical protein
MGIFSWMAEHGLDLDTMAVTASLLIAAYTTFKDEKARKIGNLLAVSHQYREIWKEVYDQPQLFRILKRDVDLNKEPISNSERLFVKLLILHLDTVYRAMKAGMFVKLQGLRKDIKDFCSLPIPKAVWETMRPLQDKDFIKFVESALR